MKFYKHSSLAESMWADAPTNVYFDEAEVDASVWGPQVFRKFDVPLTEANTTGWRECALECYHQDNPCNGFVFIEPTCYLTHSNVNSNIALGVTGTHSHFTRLCKGTS